MQVQQQHLMNGRYWCTTWHSAQMSLLRLLLMQVLCRLLVQLVLPSQATS
jgi:hypothetical protein